MPLRTRPRLLPRLLPALLLFACSSGQPEGGSADAPVAPPVDATKGAATKSALRVPPGVSVPLMPAAAPIPADAPLIILTTAGVRYGERTVAAADLSDPLAKAENEAALREPLRAALDEAARGASGKPLLVIAEDLVTYTNLRLTLELARAAGFDRCGLVVTTGPQVYAMFPARIGDGATTLPEGSIDLRVVVRPDGFRVTVGPPPPAEPGAPPPPPTIARKDESGPLYKAYSWDTDALEAMAVRILERAPYKQVTVSVDEDLRVHDLLDTIEALRGPECGSYDAPGCHVAEVVLSTEVVLLTDPRLGVAVVAGTGSGPAPTRALLKHTVEGAVDAEIVRRIGRAHRSEITSCYAAAQAKNAALVGRVDVDFTITPAGAVKGAKIRESDVDDKRLEACLLRAIKGWKFVKPSDGRDAKVHYPIELAPE
ncbi:MAG: AgmX/PglI C-terminal domain-containing protein [Nannocystaceae bacterium]